MFRSRTLQAMVDFPAIRQFQLQGTPVGRSSKTGDHRKGVDAEKHSGKMPRVQ